MPEMVQAFPHSGNHYVKGHDLEQEMIQETYHCRSHCQSE